MSEQHPMTDPLAFLQAAHARAEQAAQAATPGPWIAGSSSPHLADEVVYGQSDWPPGNLQHTCNTTYSGKHARSNAAHIALHDPAAVLDRIRNERMLLTRHSPMTGEAYGGGSTVCKECATHRPGKSSEGVPYPCATVRMLARAWGWEGARHG